MKKVLFFVCCMFFFYSVVFAEYFYVTDISYGDVDLNKLYTKEDVVSSWFYSAPTDFLVSYYDENGNLLESYGVLSSFSVDDSWLYPIGLNCNDLYDSRNEDGNHLCTLDQYSIYSSDRDISEITYWKIIETSYFDDTEAFYEFCRNNEVTHNSKICSDIILGSEFTFSDFWTYVGFIEYAPASFELVCEPENIKSGETTECKLKVDTDEEIVEVTINPSSEIYEVIDYKEIGSWTSVKNDDGTITLKNEEGFKGNEFIISMNLKFKENLLDDVVIDLDNISYKTESGVTLTNKANDKINIYEEPEVEEIEEKEENPETVGFTSVGILIILIVSLIMLIVYRKKIERGM